MNILDLNSNQKETILLIHPMLSSAQGMKSLIADQMGQEFRYGGVNLELNHNHQVAGGYDW